MGDKLYHEQSTTYILIFHYVYYIFLQTEFEIKYPAMKHLLGILSHLLLKCTVNGQDNFKRNDLYLEAGGNGLFASVNYERQLNSQPVLGVRIGVGFYTEDPFYLTIPVGINYLFQLKNKESFIDAGLGISFAQFNGKLFVDSKNLGSEYFINFIPSIGYRKHTANDVMWRISLTPTVNKYTFVPWLGFSIGKRF